MMQSYKEKISWRKREESFFVTFLVFWLWYAAIQKALSSSPFPLSETHSEDYRSYYELSTA